MIYKYSQIKCTEGESNIVGNVNIAIVASRFNSFVVNHLVEGCIYTLNSNGVDSAHIEIIYVPGAMELPLAVQNVINKVSVDGVVALGAVIRGATPHFDYVAGECASGLSRLSLEYNKPVGFGVLTTDTVEQAIERAGCKAGNKGSDAAMTVLSMISLMRKLRVEQ